MDVMHLDGHPKASAASGAVTDRPRRALSIVVPAYNEEKRITASLETLQKFLDRRGYLGEILVVSDGSTDNTVEVVNEIARRNPLVRILSYRRNRGAGHAVRVGVLAARHPAILYTDADLSTPIEELDQLWPRFDAGCDIVMASRHLQQSRLEIAQPAYRRYMSKTFRMIVSMLCVRGFRDTQCGFKLFRSKPAKEIFSRLVSDRFTFNIEALMYARKMRLKIAEVPVRWSDVDGSRIRVVGESFRTSLEIVRLCARSSGRAGNIEQLLM